MFRLMIYLLLVSAAPLTTASSHLAASESIGVLYIERILFESRTVTTAFGELEAYAKDVSQQLQAYRDQHDELKNRLATYHPSDPKFFEKNRELETLKLQNKMFLEHHQKQIAMKDLALLRELYANVRSTLNTYAAERGLTIVLMGSNPGLDEVGNKIEFQMQVATHSVLYHQAGMDITDDFLAYLDKDVPLESPIELLPVPEQPEVVDEQPAE